MVFQRKGKRIYEFKLTHGAQSATLSCGTDIAEVAKDVEACAKRYVRRREWAVVDLLITKALNPRTLYDRTERGEADAYIAEVTSAQATRDLWPLFDEWYAAKGKARRGGKSADAYKAQIERLYPRAKPFTTAVLTKQEVWTRIDTLAVEAPTKKRYKAAVSSFVGWLVAKDVLETNFTRDLGAQTTGWDEHDAREIYYEQADAKTLIAALPQPYRGLEAYAYGFAAEWSAIAGATVKDFDALGDEPPQAFVPGTKTPDRRRWVPLVPELRWLIPHIKGAIANKLPDAPAFPVSEKDALAMHYATAKAKNVVAVGERTYGAHTLHDWRHTHAVHVLQWKYDEMVAAKHLGHADVTLVRRVYGKWIPRPAEYARKKPASDRQSDRPSRTTRTKRA